MGVRTKESTGIRFAAKACLVAGICCFLAATGTAADEQRGTPRTPAADSLQKLYADLQKAIQNKDYRILQQEQAGEPTLRWREDEDASREMTARDMIALLQTSAANARPHLLGTPIGRAGLVLIGTEGWPGTTPFRYFQFKIIGRKVPRWRWVGCSGARRRDTSGDSILGDEETRLLPGLVQDLRTALAADDYTVLKRYVPEGTLYFHAPCGLGGGEAREWDLDEMAGMLQQASGQGEIIFNPYPEIRTWDGEERRFLSIDTEGWASEYPFLTFTFSQKGSSGRWRWEGVCYDVLPRLRDESSADREYFSRPVLPRPGPRRFSSDTALRARISEIVDFGELDALNAYAVKGTLIFGECSPEMLDSDAPPGRSLPAQQVVDDLKKTFPGEQQAVATRISHATFYETGGWRGKYPYVLFWFSEEPDGWQLIGVTACKHRQYEVGQSGEPFYKKVLKKLFP